MLGSSRRGWALTAAMLLSACGLQGDVGDMFADWMRETAYYYTAAQVDATNLSGLGVAWEFTDFVVRGRTNRGVQSTPIVRDGVMYLTGPWSVAYALDAKTGRLIWQYDPEVDGQFARRACCDAVNRGLALDGDRAYVATLDGYLVSLDVKTGKPLWKTDTITDRSRSYTITGAPRVAGNTVVIGNGGAEMGVRGYVTALDKKTGKLAWRFFIVPGDPAAGPDEHPEVTEARATWDPKSTWNLGGGGTAWDSIVYDPDANIVYVGTGNGSPHPSWQRSPAGGDNLFLSSILAIDADTGRKKWHYQTTPKDSWDYTATQNMVLADIRIDDKLRKVIMQAPKNGFFYVLDRMTGELLSAEKYTTVTWADRVDLKTGRPVFTEQGDYSKGPKLVWPSQAGGHNWRPMAYSEKTGLVYIPVLEAPMTFQSAPVPYQAYSVLQGVSADFPIESGPGRTDPALLTGQPRPQLNDVLRAWDPVKGKVVWSANVQPYLSGGVMVTANGLVIQGSADGYLSILDGAKGTVLRRINIGTGIQAAPMSYEIDGVQYIAFTAGLGGAFGGAFLSDWASVERENGSRLVVLKLGGPQPHLPPLRTVTPLVPAPSKFRGRAAQVARGGAMFAYRCAHCHGEPTTIGNYPNLWKMSAATHDAFEEIVLGGTFAYAGMASFADVLSKQDARDIHAYLAEPPKKGPASAYYRTR